MIEKQNGDFRRTFIAQYVYLVVCGFIFFGSWYGVSRLRGRDIPLGEDAVIAILVVLLAALVAAWIKTVRVLRRP